MTPQDQKKLLKIFNKLYPNPRSELNFKNKYQLIVAVVLSAQCTDKKVNEVTPALFKQFPSFKKLAVAKTAEVEKIIRPVNYYKTKARHLVQMARIVAKKYNSRLPLEHSKLTELPGVGTKTANVISVESGIPAIPVDTHVFRVSHRLGLSSGKNVQTTEKELKEIFPEEIWCNLHHWLIFHGRRVCKAQKSLCKECKLNTICPSSNYSDSGSVLAY